MTKIEWTQKTLNCISGCTQFSSGCAFCYGKMMTRRLKAMGQEKYAGGFDNVVIHPTAWQEVRKWKKPMRVFLNSMSDTFHEDVPWWYISWMFTMMNHYKQHTWQVLTKRAARMEELCIYRGLGINFTPNIWMGVTVESQEYLHRITHLSRVNAKVKFVSFEPLLGPIDLREVTDHNVWVDLREYCGPGPAIAQSDSYPTLPFHWAIIGGESGPKPRPMEEEWVRDLIKQCHSLGVKVFYKQRMDGRKKITCPEIDGRQWLEYPGR
jgi:protein gp37